MLDGVYRRTDGEPAFVEVPAPTDEALRALVVPAGPQQEAGAYQLGPALRAAVPGCAWHG